MVVLIDVLCLIVVHIDVLCLIVVYCSLFKVVHIDALFNSGAY